MNKILIEVPTWLGDSVMSTPAIENIIKTYPNIKITIFGSLAASAIFKLHPSVENIIIDKSRGQKNRFIWLYKIAKTLEFDAVFSFRRQFSAKFFAFFINTKNRYHYKRYDKKIKHQVERYNDFINLKLGIKSQPQKLKIYHNYKKPTKKILAINPGSSYGSAKRWYPLEFAKVAIHLANEYDIIIFGGKTEIDIARDIEKELIKNNITNYQNLAGKTTIDSLIENIHKLSLFITGDSGPMHIAASLQIPTIAIFGATKHQETNQWQNNYSKILRKDFNCSPCMERSCPLRGEIKHQCMKSIKADDVLEIIKKIETL